MDSASTYLRSKNVDVFNAAGNEVTVHCFYCPDGDPKGKGKLYVNDESWLFHCKRCDTRGGRKMLLEHFGDDAEDTQYAPGQDPAKRRRVLEEYVAHTEELLLGNEAMLLYLLRRGLSAETITEAGLGYHPRNYGAAESLPSALTPGGFTRADLIASGMMTSAGRDFHQGKITIPYLHNGSVLQVRGKDPAGKYTTPPGENVRLYNADALRGAEHVVLTEGEFDTLILQQHLRASPDPRARAIAVVAIPGAGSLPGGNDRFADYFRDAKRVYIALDPDDTGRREAVKIQALIGSKARIVELPSAAPKCDWTEYLRQRDEDHPHGGHTWRDAMNLLHEADLAGKRIYSVADAGRRWSQLEHDRPGIKLGFPTLDAILKPGLRAGNVCIPLAKTGTGKTVFLANVAYYTRHHPTLFITLEMMAPEIYGLLRRITRFHNVRYDDHQIQSHFPNLRIVDENRLQPEDLALLIEEFKDDVGVAPELIFVDYLGYYSRGSRGGSPYEKTSNAVMQLKEEAKRHEVAIIAPHQVNRGAKDGKPFDADDARDSGVVEETGDFVFGLFRPGEAVDEARASGMVSDALGLSILKSRRGGKGRIVNLSMSAASLAIVDQHDRAAVHRIQIENTAINRGEHYDDVYRRQRAAAEAKAQTTLRVVS